MAAALRTLPALDGLLGQLAAAAGGELHEQQLLRLQQSGGSGQNLVPVAHVSALMPFTAAALGTARTVRPSRRQHTWPALEAAACGLSCYTPSHPCPNSRPPCAQIRGLYHTLTLALMPNDATVVAMVEAQVAASSVGLRAVAAAQRAAMAASHRC